MKKLIPLVVTETDLAMIKTFYVDTLTWEVVIDVPGYLQLRHGADEDDPELAFGTVDALAPMGVPIASYAGKGLIVSVPVGDVDEHHRALVQTGAEPATEPTDKPWGARSYLITDPAGVQLDIFHPAEQAATTA